ncbi:MAG: beta-N-acetylhexosaminidase [Firmicutes bacterium]|nr:beta-N-acetylhexosaminidase [Bacillota bacterium]
MKKKTVWIAFLLIFALAFGGCGAGPEAPAPAPEPEVSEPAGDPGEPAPEVSEMERLLASLSLEEKLGQMVFVGIDGTSLDEETLAFIQNRKVGNIILFAKNIEDRVQLIALNREIQEAVGMVPAFIGIDQEGGIVSRIRLGEDATFLPSGMTVAASGDSINAYQLGVYMAKELRAFGINFNFAPVLDVNSNPDNPVIGTRSYSDDPAVAAAFGSAMIAGLKSGGVIGCGKHFPGHGDTDVDSHYGLPLIEKTREELDAVELVPFKAAVEQGAEAIMTSHILFPALESEEVPATMSDDILQGLLREEMGFTGLIVSDGMQMAAISEHYGLEDGCVAAVNAGVDILILGHGGANSGNLIQSQEACLVRLKEAVDAGEIPMERIDDAVLRILEYKFALGLFENAGPDTDALSEDWSAHASFVKETAAAAVTVVKDENGLLPIKEEDLVLVVSPWSNLPVNPDAADSLENTFSHLAYNTVGWNFRNVSRNPDDSDIRRVTSLADTCDKVILVTTGVQNNPGQKRLAEALLKGNPNLILIAADLPYDVSRIPGAGTALCIYEYTQASCEGALKVLTGEREATGILPVQLEKE